MSEHDADLIIAGAGCAGLSALWYALHGPARRRRIVLVDRDLEPRDDRTWSFWGSTHSPFAHLADRRWCHVGVRFPGWESVQVLGRTTAGPRSYLRVRRRDYDRAILAEADAAANVVTHRGDVVEIRDDADGAVVRLADGELRAPLVLQSLGPPPAPAAGVRHPLRQHFGGWEVRTEHPVFRPDVVTLMDFDVDQFGATCFTYVLPDAPDHALVEFTMISPDPRERSWYDACVAERLDAMGAGSTEIIRREYGVIPMEDRAVPQRSGRHVWNIGTAGGRTKPSSGYTFQRIHAQTRWLIQRWAANDPLVPLPASPRRYAFTDRTLLNVLHRHPERGRPVFERLFRSTPIDDVLTFLDERSSLAADARLVAHLPWAPFLRAAASELGAIAASSSGRWR